MTSWGCGGGVVRHIMSTAATGCVEWLSQQRLLWVGGLHCQWPMRPGRPRQPPCSPSRATRYTRHPPRTPTLHRYNPSTTPLYSLVTMQQPSSSSSPSAQLPGLPNAAGQQQKGPQVLSPEFIQTVSTHFSPLPSSSSFPPFHSHPRSSPSSPLCQLLDQNQLYITAIVENQSMGKLAAAMESASQLSTLRVLPCRSLPRMHARRSTHLFSHCPAFFASGTS